MAEDNCSGGCPKIRKILGDVTNLPGKRGFSSILGKFLGEKSVEGNFEKIDKKEGKGVGSNHDLADDKDRGKRACVSPGPCSEINSWKGNGISGILRIASENKEQNLGVGNGVIEGSSQTGNYSKGSCEDVFSRPESVAGVDSVEVVEVTCDSDEGRVSSVVFHGDDTHAPRDEVDEDGIDSVVLSQSGSVDCGKSQESRSFQLERCSGLKADGCLNSNADVGVIKSCSCSFCTKAGYIWLDLHYQDMKGRIAALKKSQKDASTLAERSCRVKATERNGSGSSGEVSKLEHDLMTQWKSLFLQMGEIFKHEDKQLGVNLLSLRELRDKFKTELEVINGTTSEN